MSDPPPRRQRVPWWELQDRFNAGDYWRRALAGEFLCEAQPRPTPTKAASADEPAGTLGYTITYLDRETHRRVFKVHLYLRPDGTIGGRDAVQGREPRPDPKVLVESGVEYCFRSPTPEELAAFERRVAARRGDP